MTRTTAESPGNLERRLAESVVDTVGEAIPEATIDAARRQVVWTLGSCLLGLGRDREAGVVAALRDLGGPGTASVIGSTAGASPVTAGAVHGYLAKVPEYEDKYWIGGSHGYAVAAGVVPAAFAMADALGGVSGKRLLAAIVLAVDLQARLLVSTPDYTTDTGWNATYLYSSLGTAAAAARLMELDAARTLDALGIAFAQAAGAMQCNAERAGVIPVQLAFGVRNGLSAATLAQRGVTGPHEFLTGGYGLYNLQMAGQKLDLDRLLDGLGRRYLGDRIAFKAYPCGAVAHPALDAVREVVGEGLAAENIERIRVVGSTRLGVMLRAAEAPGRNGVTGALFSLPWVLACVAVDGNLGLGHFEAAALADPRYGRVSERIEVVAEDARDDVVATVELTDGRTLASPPVRIPRGHPDRPLTTDEIIARYWDCWRHGSPDVQQADAERALRLILTLERVGDASDVLACLRAKGDAG
ncbi:MAG TPA: MmgE/PrpD family protein [Actinophytocola sp.]|nr:MmgE/PrpD family protein [Actinophytocola sp.]